MIKVNALAERYGFAPHEFVAVLDDPGYRAEVRVLTFESPKTDDQERQAQFQSMLEQLGVSELNMNLIAPGAGIIETLDKALRVAPKQRWRS
ncbi:MAG TPA: hypothetical protein VGP68_06065 [Gemmataceae bacterium]|nr:hypothetical protein [Gemmataceae bacterium]